MNPLFRLAALFLLITGLQVSAQDDPKVLAHPATKVVRDYLQLVLQREWNKSAALVEPRSLDQLHKDFLNRLKKAPTMDDEAEMISRVGKKTLAEVESMSPLLFYIAYHQGIQERWKVSPEVIKKVRDSLKVRFLCIGEEDAEHVHILVRTKHSNEKALIENLELLSLIKVSGNWKVALNEQAPRITPLDSALPPSAPPAKAVAEEAAAPSPKAAPAKSKPKPKTK